MNYIKLSKNETLKSEIAKNDVECFKIVEERLSPSGRYEYRTFPLYVDIPEEVINGVVPFLPKENGKIQVSTVEDNTVVTFGAGFVHVYANLEDATKYIEKHGYGHPQTRTTIYQCIIPKGTEYYTTLKSDYPEPITCYSTYGLCFIKPLFMSAIGMKNVCEYKRIEKPEKKKKVGVIFKDEYFEDEEFLEEE